MNELPTTDRKSDEPTSRRLLPRHRRSTRASVVGLGSHLLPLVVLVAGAMWLMTTMKSAEAQFSTRPYSQPATTYQPNGFPANNYAPQTRVATGPNAIPSIPSAAMTQPTAQAEPATAEQAGFLGYPWGIEMPSIIGKVAQGGWLMLPLAICSLIVIALSLERMIALRRGRVIPRPFVRRFTECVEDGQLSYDEATEICKDFDCPVSTLR